jgi:hypothetical protein
MQKTSATDLFFLFGQLPPPPPWELEQEDIRAEDVADVCEQNAWNSVFRRHKTRHSCKKTLDQQEMQISSGFSEGTIWVQEF